MGVIYNKVIGEETSSNKKVFFGVVSKDVMGNGIASIGLVSKGTGNGANSNRRVSIGMVSKRVDVTE